MLNLMSHKTYKPKLIYFVTYSNLFADKGQMTNWLDIYQKTVLNTIIYGEASLAIISNL